MGRSKTSRRAKEGALEEENGTNLPHAPPPTSPPFHSLARALPRQNFRAEIVLAVIRAFEAGTADAAVERLRHQTENVLLALLERLGDEQAAIRNLAAGALRNNSFDDPRIVEVLMQSKVLDVLNGLVARLPHLCRVMQQSCARAGTALLPRPRCQRRLQIPRGALAVVLNMARSARRPPSTLGSRPTFPSLFQLLVMPVYYDEGNDLKCLDQVPLLYPHADLQAAALLHTLRTTTA